jgi:nitrous oxide reductase accessory protein NosL
VNERTIRPLVGAVVLSAALAGCSSSGPSPASTAPSGVASTAAADPAQVYVDAVNALCDALLPKIVTVTHGGSIDVPAREYLATWPAHKRLLEGFDAHVATITVPSAAAGKAAALSAYVRFADQLDAARLAAAQKGRAAYAKEVRSESGVENDPTIAALAAAGFNDSCTAR